MISFSEARQIQCGGKIEDLSAFWKTISRVEQEWRDMISEMDQENFAEVDRDNCALKLTQRRKNRGKSNQVLFIKSKQNMHLGKKRDGRGGEGGRGREGNRSMGKMANEISFVCSVIADSAPGVFG